VEAEPQRQATADAVDGAVHDPERRPLAAYRIASAPDRVAADRGACGRGSRLRDRPRRGPGRRYRDGNGRRVRGPVACGPRRAHRKHRGGPRSDAHARARELGALDVRTVERDDVEALRDDLDAKIVKGSPRGRRSRRAGRLVTSMCAEMVSAKKREFRTRKRQPVRRREAARARRQEGEAVPLPVGVLVVHHVRAGAPSLHPPQLCPRWHPTCKRGG
jgi:hypothetical protein